MSFDKDGQPRNKNFLQKMKGAHAIYCAYRGQDLQNFGITGSTKTITKVFPAKNKNIEVKLGQQKRTL